MRINNIAKNTSYFTFALILQKIIAFTFFTIMARNLVPEDLGKFYFAISFTTIFAIFIDIGLANVLMREVAKRKKEAGELMGSVIMIKIPLAFLSLLSVFILVNAMNYPELTRKLVYFSSLAMLLDSFTVATYACLRGFHNLKYESIGAVVYQAIVLIFGLISLKLGLSLKWLMGAFISASVFNYIYSSALLYFKLKIKPFPKYNSVIIKSLLTITIPFAFYGIIQRLYMYLDSVFLSILAGDKYVGLYQVAFKIIFALQFLPMAFIASLYPAFASYWKSNKSQLVVSFERAMNYLIIISLPISIGVIALADKIVLIFKPEYTEAVFPLQLIMASLILIFINFPIGSLLNACDKQKINTINMGITLAASIILNIILIPKYQAVGASITVVITNFLMFLLGIYQVPKIIKFNPRKIFIILIKSIIAVGVMAGYVLLLKPILNIVLIIISAGLIYFIVLLILGGIKKEDIVSIFRSFITRNS